MSPTEKLAVEVGPLAVFGMAFVLSKFFPGIFGGEGDPLIHATGALIVAMLIALGYSYKVERKVSATTLVTAVVVIVLGGLTIISNDETFIKQKPTYVSGVIGSVLLIGLAFGRPFVKYLLQGAIQMQDAGWRKLTLRWGVFMLLLAGLNEVVWRNFSTETWLSYKLFGILPLTFVFLLSQGPLIAKYSIDPPLDSDVEPSADPALGPDGEDDQSETPSSE